MISNAAPWGRAWYRYVSPLVLLCVLPACLFGTCIKELNYRILETRTQAIEQGIDVSTLPLEDLLNGKSDYTYYDISVCIDATGFVTRTTIRTQSDNSFYPDQIHKLIYSASGISSYNKKGDPISTKPHDPVSIQNIPGIGLALTPAQISTYGLNVDFQALSADYAAHFASLQSTQWQVGTKEYFSSSVSDAIISPNDLYTLTTTYDHAGDIQSMQANGYQERNGYIIPHVNVLHEYKDLSQGRLQSTTQKTYLSYEVIDNGVTLVSFAVSSDVPESVLPQQTKYQTKLGDFKLPKRATPLFTLYPNPVSDVLYVQFIKTMDPNSIDWTITNLNGQIVKSGQSIPKQRRLNVAVNDLSSGHYVFRYTENSTPISSPFIIIK